MGKYKIISGQNLYDVALHIYGSIEGITDLLINNPSLSLSTRLKDGDELIYTDDFLIDADVAAYFRTNGLAPSNGERHVYFKEPSGARVMEIRTSEHYTSVEFSASGSGVMEVDWGDNTPLEQIVLKNRLTKYHHSFDNAISTTRKVRLYGEFRWGQVDFTALHPSSVLCLTPIYTEEFALHDCYAPLDFLQMFQGLFRIDLSGMKIRDMAPLVECREVMELDLSRIDTLRDVLDEYLIGLVRRHYGRRNCKVTLSEYPSGEYSEPERDQDLGYALKTGMEAVWLLTNEPSWNEGGPWEFIIEEKNFRHDPYPDEPENGNDDGEKPANPI